MLYRSALSFFLLVAVLSANFSRLYVFAGFGLNQKYIAANLCENRYKPWMHCNGHCYLLKKIKQAVEKGKNDERQTQKSLFQEGFITTPAGLKFHTALLQILLTPYHASFITINYRVLFRPPQVV